MGPKSQVTGSWLPAHLLWTLLLLVLMGATESRTEVIWTANLNYSYVLSNKSFVDEGEFGVFGNESPVNRVSGLLILPRKERSNERGSYTACSSKVNFTIPSSWTGTWIALIQRGGGCTFADKINAAGLRGADGVIIFNNDGSASNEVIEMSHPGTADTVAIMIGNEKGNEILQLLIKGIQVNMAIEVGKKHGSWINHYSIFFVSVSFFIVTAATIGYFVFYSARRWRVTRAHNQKLRKLKDEASKAIGQLQLRTIKQGDKVLGPDGDSCAVCIESYKTNDVVRILTCNHFFHKTCIDPWLLEHRTCPMCKCDILKSLGIPPEEEQETSAVISSVSSDLHRSTMEVEDETRSDNASSGYASVHGIDDPVDEADSAYENVDLVDNEVSATTVEVLPHLDNPTFEIEETHEMKS
ncbi:E3 ubiquitin-protein ligase RNF128 [Pelodytes ibericus]